MLTGEQYEEYETELVALAFAADPSSPSTLLGQLARRSPALGRAVAGNPSATPRILRCIAMMWREARAEVARHPELERTLASELAMTEPAALLANPMIAARIAGRRSLPRQALAQLLEQPERPDWLLPALVDHPRPRLRELAAGDARATEAQLRQLATDDEWPVVAAAAGNPATPAEVVWQLAGPTGYDNDYCRLAAAARPDLPAELAAQLARASSSGVRVAVAKSVREADILDRLAADPEAVVRRHVAGNPATAAAALLRLAGDDAAEVKAAVAGNPRSPAAALARLLEVRHTPRGAAGDRLFATALDHPATPPEWFAKLAASADPSDWQRVAQSPRAPRQLVMKLASNSLELVRAAAARSPVWEPPADADGTSPQRFDADAAALAHQLAGDRAEVVRWEIAKRTRSQLLLRQLATDRSALVRSAIAASPHTSPAVLVRLASEETPHVLAAVAGNPRLPVEELQRLARHPGDDVWRAAATNPALPVVRLLEAASAWPSTDDRIRILALRFKDLAPDDPALGEALGKSSLFDQALAGCRGLQVRAACALTQSPFVAARVTLARTTPSLKCLSLLCSDSEASVRIAVAERLAALPPVVSSLDLRELGRQPRVLGGDAVSEVRTATAWWTVDPEVLEELSKDPKPAVRLTALGNPATPPSRLLRALRSGGEEAKAARQGLAQAGHPRAGRRPRKPHR